MMNNLLLVLSLTGFALGIMACGILLFSNKSNKHANRLLATALICLVATMLATFLFAWNIDFYAYIFRFPSPLLYLLFPATYLYIRSVIRDETRLNRRDILHFLLPVLYFIEILPYYFTDYEYRRSLVKELVNQPRKLIDLSEGVLPAYYHTTLLIVQAMLYMFLVVRILQKGSRVKEGNLFIRQTSTFRWIKAFTFLIGINSIPMLFFLLGKSSFFYFGMQFVLIILALSFLVINLYLFFQPEILYGIPQKTMILPKAEQAALSNTIDADKAEEDSIEEAISLQEDAMGKYDFSNLKHYKPLLESYMKLERPFLKQGYTINDLSRETGIPQHHLSALINRIYKMRFNEYLNRIRISYISENFKNPAWEKLTIEGIAKQAGFTSRTTFFNSIKKTTGLSPSEFMEQTKMANPKMN